VKKGGRVAILRIETTEKLRGLDTPAENAGYSTGFFNTLMNH
jgi:hypothetical protein